MADSHVTQTKDALRDWTPREGDVEWPPHLPLVAQIAGRWEAMLRAVALMVRHGLDVRTARVLEIGVAVGEGLAPFTLAGFRLEHLHGVDLFEDRLVNARRTLPGATLIAGDGADLRPHFVDQSMDLVMQQFCFCHIPTDAIKPVIAAEMIRVVKPGGFILLHDWRMDAPSRYIRGLTQARIRRWFSVGSHTDVIGRFPSQLWPPIGRRLSAWAPGLYQLGWLFPPLVGSRMTVLRRRQLSP